MYHHNHEHTPQQSTFHPHSYKNHEHGIFQRAQEPTSQTDELHRKLQTLNIELRCAGMQDIRMCQCDPEAVQSCIKSIRALISDGAQMRTRLKFMQQTATEERNTRIQRQREKETLTAERESILRERDGLTEKLRALNREVRQRDQKLKAERESFAKERRLWGQKEESIRKQSAHLEDNARRLTEQLKKINNKNDKTQYRNVFQVFVPVSNRMQEREFEFTVTNTIQQHTRVLSQQAETMKEALKEVFGRLQNIAINLDPQQLGEHHRPQIIDLPNIGKSTYIEHLRRFLSVIEDRSEELRSRQGEADPTELLHTVNRLKGFFSNYEVVNQGRQAIMDRMFSVAREREKFGKLSQLLQRRQMDERDEKQSEPQKSETERYVQQRIAYFEDEFKRFDRFNRCLQDLRESPLQLTDQE